MMAGQTRALAALLAAAGFAAAGAPDRPPAAARSGPASNLEYWLGQAQPATAQATPTPPPANPFSQTDRFRRSDALPGVLILSDGKILAGGVYTTRDKNWQVWVESEKRWRHIPPILVLSITADVIEKGMEKQWRWKEMGSDEKVYTGRAKPIRRFRWRFHLIDGSTVTGAVKGQPVWIEAGAKRRGPFVLHERSDGQYGQTLEDLVYVERVVISRKAMDQVRAREQAERPGSQPAGGAR